MECIYSFGIIAAVHSIKHMTYDFSVSVDGTDSTCPLRYHGSEAVCAVHHSLSMLKGHILELRVARATMPSNCSASLQWHFSRYYSL